ncbi:hypothetical protein ATY35_17000 [Vibrio cidicii]|uniref:HDOD domain-containing protein n=1 Tax=Vibrio cidicii TaxID=1763883 RepID=A0ABR5VZU4_9VIBR|nr:HDOD domain-containing protein [Vibrio cidicii]EJL6400801.1 HDOD domain-containing protein [Vibrio navarrensis]EJL6568306.1 HDOD domain-containing protein [Vibrio navarrensis]KYN85066.1 hypothetical protein ATY35_17000 [Vibrio cidicii]MBG0761664.1 hypothetical protein [Vibrio cidicii]
MSIDLREKSPDSLLQAIMTNRRYSTEANQIADKVSSLTRARHAKWLVNRQLVLDQENVDTALSEQARYCDSVILHEKERVTQNQRLLLACESARVKDQRLQVEQRQRVHAAVVQDVVTRTETMMQEQLLSMSPVSLFGRFPDFSHLMETAYSPSLSVSKLAVLTTNDSALKMEVLSLMSNARFLARLHRQPKRVTEASVAIGTLGVENCVRLFPILMAKSLVKWHEPSIKLVVPKMWQYLMVTGNATYQRLRVAGGRAPEQGLLLGVLHCLGMFAVINQYPRFFEDALIERMQVYREQQERDKYYACAEVVQDMSALPKLVTSLAPRVTQHLIDAMTWSPGSLPLRLALEEEINQVPVLERSLLGVALAQGSAFAIFDTLERSQVFIEKHKPFWFANVQLSAKGLDTLCQSDLGRLHLSDSGSNKE